MRVGFVDEAANLRVELVSALSPFFRLLVEFISLAPVLVGTLVEPFFFLDELLQGFFGRSFCHPTNLSAIVPKTGESHR
jgi:hypothetical protein